MIIKILPGLWKKVEDISETLDEKIKYIKDEELNK